MTKIPQHPEPERPFMPGYGIQEADEGLLSWSRARERLESSRNYWIVTTRPDGRPHAAPVWGVWLDEAFYFGTGVNSQKANNLAANPYVVVHLESGDDVLILEGVVKRVTDTALFARLDQAYGDKYDFRPLQEVEGDLPEDPYFVLKHQVAFAWLERDFPDSATRWQFI